MTEVNKRFEKYKIPTKEGLLVATICIPEKSKKVGMLRIAGGANTSHWPNSWQERLAQFGIITLAFDFAGVGNSEGELNRTNLLVRFEEAEQVYNTFLEKAELKKGQVFLMGGSMGGPLAIWLSIKENVPGLILSVPAAYSLESHNKNYGPDFSAAIRKVESWKDSKEFSLLEKFSGKIMLAFASHDEVIPLAVTKKYEQIVREKNGKILQLSATHRFMREESSEFQARERFWNEVASFITRIYPEHKIAYPIDYYYSSGIVFLLRH